MIYYWIKSEDTFYMLMLYEKSKRSDLTKAQAEILRKVVAEELG